MWRGNFRLFYFSQEVEREISHEDMETGEVTTETIKEWLCDVVEYEGEESKEINRLIKEGEDSIECQKWLLRAKINAYDKSRHVEGFTIGGTHLWLDSSLRGKVKENLETCEWYKETETILRFEGMSFPMPVSVAWQMYYAVLAYARDAWNVTEDHLAFVNSTDDVEAIKAYDYTSGYPQKLAF